MQKSAREREIVSYEEVQKEGYGQASLCGFRVSSPRSEHIEVFDVFRNANATDRAGCFRAGLGTVLDS